MRTFLYILLLVYYFIYYHICHSYQRSSEAILDARLREINGKWVFWLTASGFVENVYASFLIYNYIFIVLFRGILMQQKSRKEQRRK